MATTKPIEWDNTAERIFETGVDHGVLYPKTGASGAYAAGVAWNGLISVSEKPTGADANPIYADNMKYLNLTSIEEFEGTIEAYTYPDEFGVCDGSKEAAKGLVFNQQERKEFGFCFRSKVGNADDAEAGYKLHIIYGALASPSEKSFETVNDNPDAITFSWDFTTTPIDVANYRPVAHVVIDSTKADTAKLAALETILYGSETAAARLPLPAELITLLSAT